MSLIKYFIIFLMTLMVVTAATFKEYSSVDAGRRDIENGFKMFGRRLIKRRSTNQEKRDISLSYAATNINNKEGTQVKTITVIKNLNDKNKKLKIDPKLHENENWAKAFKDNFDSYGIIPDVPDVDDLFEYVNKKHNNNNNKNNKNNENEKENEKEKDKKNEMMTMMMNENNEDDKTEKSRPKNVEKPVTEISSEISDEVTEIMKNVEKIKGDAELLPNFNSSRIKVRESLINLNYSAPGHSVHQYFDNYVQLNTAGKAVLGYNYPKPCVHPQPVGSVTVATPSGKTYNIPGNNNSYINPYLAPSITRRPQVVQQSTQSPPANAPVFPINSLVPPLQQANGNNNPSLNNFLPQQNPAGNGAGQQPQQQQPQTPNNSLQPPIFQNNLPTNTQQPQQQPTPQQNQQPQSQGQAQNAFVSTSQRPYVSPNIRSGLSGVSRGPGANSNANVFPNGQPNYRINTFNNAFRKPNAFRSRGLKY